MTGKWGFTAPRLTASVTTSVPDPCTAVTPHNPITAAAVRTPVSDAPTNSTARSCLRFIIIASPLWIPSIRTAQYGFDVDGFGFSRRQLSRPRNTLLRIGTGTNAIKLRVPHGFLSGRILPIIPSFRSDHFGHFCVQVYHAGKWPPRTPQICFHSRRFAGDLTIREDETMRLFLRR